MFVRESVKRKGSKVYRYAQLVESYRRKDGMPAQRVVAKLGNRTEQEIQNIKLALKASRQNKAIVLLDEPESSSISSNVLANLQYLDIAIALETWERWKISEILNRLLPQKMDAVPASAVIAVLTMQRCVAPGSKLYAERWFPRTCLPELLSIDIKHFNNTRIHRVLDELDRIESDIQKALTSRYEVKEGAFATLFMDVSDAWFQGRGCEMAQRHRTKEGLSNRYKVGIVLVCNEHGYPLRWKTVPGKRHDALCMQDMLEEIQKEPWVGDIPFVFDRAMGRASAVAKLIKSGVSFLTATTRVEIPSYTSKLPTQPFVGLSPIGAEETTKSEIAIAAKTAEQSGMTKVDDLLYILDLGVVQCTLVYEKSIHEYSGAEWDPNELEGGAVFLTLARLFQQRLESKEINTQTELGRKEGLSRARVTQIMNNLRLDQQLQERLLRGEFGYVSERLLRKCVKFKSEAKQRRLLEDNAQRMRSMRKKSPHSLGRTGRQKVKVRLVAYFNPQMFVQQRALASAHRNKIEQFVKKLNENLRSPKSRREEKHIQVQVANELARYHMANIFDVQLQSKKDEQERTHWQVELVFSEQEWLRRIRYAGFVLLVGHPDLPHSAEEIVKLYRAKDTVEKDFQTIKDVVKLRPIYHYSDSKVRAHVSLCMLALLLERTIEKRLKKSGLTNIRSGAACFEVAHDCHLNMVKTDLEGQNYLLTEPTQEQKAILRSLRMTGLIVQEEISERIQPRN